MTNDSFFSREAVISYVGTYSRSDDQRKTRNNSKKYGSFATYISHHQPDRQDKCIFCSHKVNLGKYEKYLKKKSTEKRSKFLVRKNLCYGCHKPISMTKEYARFVKRNTFLADMVALQSRKLEMIILVHQVELKITFESDCAKFDNANGGASGSCETVSTCIASVKVGYATKGKKLPHIPFWIIAARKHLKEKTSYIH